MNTRNNFNENGFMNRKMQEFVDKLYAVVDALGDEFSWKNINGENIFMGYYDEADGFGKKRSYYVPKERVEKDLQKLTAIVMDYYRYCCDTGDYDSFATAFAMYCNFYIDRGLICRRKDAEGDMFGLHCADFAQAYDGKLLPYLKEIFKGIYTQDYITHFGEAERIVPEFSVAHLYLMTFFCSWYYNYEFLLGQELENPEYQRGYNENRQAMTKEYWNLAQAYQEYVFGRRRFQRSGNPNDDRHLLPYISTMTMRDILHENLEIHSRVLVQSMSKPKISAEQIALYITLISDTLETLSDDSLNEPDPITTRDRAWRKMSIAERRYYLHICNLVIFSDSLPFLNLDGYLIQIMMNEQLQITQNELLQAQNENRSIVRQFSHTYSNMKATTLQEVGNDLLDIDDDLLRNYGRKVLVEYSIKENLTKEVEMLTLQFENRSDELIRLMRSTVGHEKKEYMFSVEDVISDSLNRCFMNLLYDNTVRGRDRCNLFFGTTKHEKIKEQLRDSFEDEVIVDEKFCLDWIREHQCIDLKLSVSGLWEKLFFGKGGYAALSLTGWFSELFNNVIKYADKTAPVILELSEDGEFLCICMNNRLNPAVTAIHNTQEGINSIGASVRRLNKAIGFEGEFVSSELTNTEFTFGMRFASGIFMEGR